MSHDRGAPDRAEHSMSTKPPHQPHPEHSTDPQNPPLSVSQRSSHLVPEHEQRKDFNLFLVSLPSPSLPNPFSLQQGVHQDQGCKETLGRRACCMYIHRNSALAAWNPDKNPLSSALRVLMCEEKPPPSLSLLSSNHFPSQPGP